MDGAAALEYLEKALEVASHTFQQAQAYAGMSYVHFIHFLYTPDASSSMGLYG